VRIIGDCIWTALLQTARRVFCCRGGELLDRLNEQKGAHYSEKVACNYVHTMLSAIRYGLQWDLPPICRAEGDDLLLLIDIAIPRTLFIGISNSRTFCLKATRRTPA
jgi:hypothetical protein